MRLNRATRAAAVAALTTTAVVGMPAAITSSAAAIPIGPGPLVLPIDDDPGSGTPEAEQTTPPAQEDSSVIKVPVVEGEDTTDTRTPEQGGGIEAGDEEFEEAALPVAVPDQLDPVTEAVDPIADVTVPAKKDKDSDAELPGNDDQPNQPSGNDGQGNDGQGGGQPAGSGNGNGSGAGSGNDGGAPTGQIGTDQNSPTADGSVPQSSAGCAADANFGCVTVAAQPQERDADERGRDTSDGTTADGAVTTTAGSGNAAGGSAGDGLPQTGGASSKLLGAGLGMVLVGLGILGTGRHRRTGEVAEAWPSFAD